MSSNIYKYIYRPRNKYGNKKTTVDTGNSTIRFDSKKEAARFKVLQAMVYSEEIRDLKLQPHFTLQEGFKTLDGESVKAIVYVADFSYYKRSSDADGWEFIVEDVKGQKTDVYKIKKKMMQDVYGITVQEI